MSYMRNLKSLFLTANRGRFVHFLFLIYNFTGTTWTRIGFLEQSFVQNSVEYMVWKLLKPTSDYLHKINGHNVSAS